MKRAPNTAIHFLWQYHGKQNTNTPTHLPIHFLLESREHHGNVRLTVDMCTHSNFQWPIAQYVYGSTVTIYEGGAEELKREGVGGQISGFVSTDSKRFIQIFLLDSFVRLVLSVSLK